MATTPELTEDEARTWQQYRRMRTLLDLAITRDVRAASGLSDADLDVLAVLADGQRWRARDLAQSLLWSSSRLAHQLGRMEARGLLRRAAVKDDGRGASVTVTAAGRRALTRAQPLQAEAVRRHLFDALSATELRTLHRIATRVATRLDTAE